MDATQYKQAILQTLDAIGGEVTACADAIHGYAELSGGNTVPPPPWNCGARIWKAVWW